MIHCLKVTQKNPLVMAALFKTPSFLAGAAGSCRSWGWQSLMLRSQMLKLTWVSCLSMAMLCRIQVADMYSTACSGHVLSPKWSDWNFLFNIPKVCSIRTRVRHKLALNLSSAGVRGARYGVIKYLVRGSQSHPIVDHRAFLDFNNILCFKFVKTLMKYNINHLGIYKDMYIVVL